MSNPVAPFAVLSGEGTPLEIPFGGSVTIKAHQEYQRLVDRAGVRAPSEGGTGAAHPPA
jgi:hypothetical protein